MKSSTINEDHTKREAETILNQLGGTRRLAMMTGAKNFAYGTSTQTYRRIVHRHVPEHLRTNAKERPMAGDKKYNDEGMRMTDCCGCVSTYHDDTLCCKRCWEAVPHGQGDGMEYRDNNLVLHHGND